MHGVLIKDGELLKALSHHQRRNSISCLADIKLSKRRSCPALLPVECGYQELPLNPWHQRQPMAELSFRGLQIPGMGCGCSTQERFPCLDPITQPFGRKRVSGGASAWHIQSCAQWWVLGCSMPCMRYTAVLSGVTPDTVPSWPSGWRAWTSCYPFQSLFLTPWLQFKGISSMC